MIRLHNRNLLAAILVVSALFGFLLLVIHGWPTIILGLLYAIFLPGFMSLLAIQRSIRLTWHTFIYTLALGVVSFIVLALLVNSLGLLFHNTTPLTLENLIIANFALIAALSTRYKHWDIQINPPKRLTRLEIGSLIASSILVAASVTGAVLLNNEQPGWVSFSCFLAIPLLLVFLFWKNNSLRSGVTATNLWLIAVALLLSGWLRSWYIAGPDVSLEYKLADMVSSAHLWSLDTIKHAYNACLSVSLFAPALGIITKTSLILIFKFVVPILYSAVVPIVFLLTKRYLSERGGIVGAAFFMTQPVFVVWWWIPLRQQVAFLLFGTILLLITEYKARDRRTLSLLLILSLGLVVAHYTTALIAIAYFVIVWLTARLLSRNKRFTSLKSPVPPVIIVLLIAAYFIWYAQLTYGFNGVTQFITKSFGGISSLVTHEKQENEAQKKPFDILTALSSTPPPPSLDAYSEKRINNIRNAYGEKNMYTSDETEAYTTSITKQPNEESGVLQVIRQGFISLSKLLIILSIIVVVWRAASEEKLRRYAALALGALATLIFTIALPSFSASYDIVRTYQQLLFVMASMFALVFLVRKRWQKIASTSLMAFVAIYFVLTSHMLSFLDSSPSVPVNLANAGTEYTYRYVDAGDIALGQWLANNTHAKATISGDSLARDRLRQTLDPNRSQAMLNTVMPTGLPRNGYVIQNKQANATNAYETYESQLFSFNFPTHFLEDKKNIIYSNSGNRLFR